MQLRILLACFGLFLCFDIPRVDAAAPSTLPTQGRVTSADGKPVAGATVWVIRSLALQKPQVLLKTTSRADGSFDLPTSAPVAPADGWLQTIVRADGLGTCGSRGTFEIRMPAATTVRVKLQRQDGAPIAGVKLATSFLASARWGPEGTWIAHIPDELLSEFAATSDAEGIVTFRDLPRDANIRFLALDESFARCAYRESIDTSVDRDVPTALTLLRSAVIEGRVIGADGKPVPGVYVSAQGIDASATTGASTYTDEQGRYALKQMRPGTFNVAIGLTGDLAESWTAVAYERFEIAEGQRFAGKDFQLIPGTLITGKVTDADTGKPLAGLSIGVYGPAHPKSGAWVQSSKTGADGMYRLRVPAGEQYVYLSSSAPEGYLEPRVKSKVVKVTDADGATVDFALPPDPNPPLVGRVIDANGKPVPQALVRLERVGVDVSPYVGEPSKTTDDDGRFAFASVPSGSRLRASKANVGTRHPVSINADERQIAVTLEDGYLTDITGVVTDADGKPIADAQVSLIVTRGSFGIGSPPQATDAQGRYRFRDKPIDERYSVSAHAKGYGEADAKLFIEPGDTNDAPPLKLPRADSFVAGKVVDADGKPVAGVKVYLATNQRPEQTTDASGAFRFDGVVPGKPASIYVLRPGEDMPAGTINTKPGSSNVVIKLRPSAPRT